MHGVLTLEEAIALARKGNHDIEAARARVAQTAALVTQALAALLPQATAQGRYTHNYKDVTFTTPMAPPGVTGFAATGLPSRITIMKGDELHGVASVSVPLIVPWAYPALRAARLSETAGVAKSTASERATLLTTAQAFFALAGTQEVLRARESAIEVARRTLAHADSRHRSGNTTQVEVGRATVALLRAEQSSREAAVAVRQAERALSALIQVNPPLRVAPLPSASAMPEVTYGQALRLRPEFVGLKTTIGAFEAQRRSYLLRWLPSLSAFGAAHVYNFHGFSGDRYAWAVGLSLDWTLYDGGVRDSQRRLAHASRWEWEARQRQILDSVADEMANAKDIAQVKRQAEETAAKSTELSRQTLALIRSQYEAGAATQLDLLQAQDGLVAAEVGLVQARFDVAVADVMVRYAAGTFP